MAVYWTADSYFRQNKYNLAIENYKKFGLLPSTTAPGLKSEALYSLGYCYLERADAYHAKGNKPQRENELKKSGTAFRSFVDADPGSEEKRADALMRIGDSYFVLKQNIEAISFYKK